MSVGKLQSPYGPISLVQVVLQADRTGPDRNPPDPDRTGPGPGPDTAPSPV